MVVIEELLFKGLKRVIQSMAQCLLNTIETGEKPFFLMENLVPDFDMFSEV